jgi:hypothetical protein
MTGLLTALVLLLMLGSDSTPAQPSAPKPKPPGPTPGPTKPQPTTPTTPVTPQVVPTVTPTAPKPAAIPVSWPVAAPKGLPAFPSGWEADVPPPAAVSARAWALLPTLWKSGKAGATAVEQTAGRWITYQASVPSKGKRGVVAWRIKGNPPAGSLPSGNVQV